MKLHEGNLNDSGDAKRAPASQNPTGWAGPAAASPTGTGWGWRLEESSVTWPRLSNQQMEQSKEEEQLREGMFLIGQGKAGLTMRAIYPRAEVSFSASHFPNSNLLGVYFFHIGEMKHDKAARCGPSLMERSQPAEHPVCQLAQCIVSAAPCRSRGKDPGTGDRHRAQAPVLCCSVFEGAEVL